MNLKINLILSFLLCSFHLFGQGQFDYRLHSHNDYLQKAPFWTALASGAHSIEVDVILRNGKLMVAHEPETIKEEWTIESLYLDPIRKAQVMGIGALDFQLLVDIKTEAYASMEVLQKSLANYSDILSTDPSQGVRVVVSGSRPAVEDYVSYPAYIWFDYQQLDLDDTLPWDKIAMVSLPYKRVSVWNGKGKIVEEEQLRIEEIRDMVHAYDRPLRFWGAPDSKTAWKAFYDLKINYINTDSPYEASQYLKSLPQNVVRGKRSHEIYTPDFMEDGKPEPIRQVILMIGDGNGLAQISAALYGHGGQLNLSQLKHIGLLKTQSADDFTTDSAAGATALATGTKANNRAIGFSPDGKALMNLPERIVDFGYRSGIVTTDHMTGASPASFYAHRQDRDMILPIADDLSKSVLDLIIGAGKNDFLTLDNDYIKPLEQAGFHFASSLDALAVSRDERVGYFASNQGLPTVEKGREGFLARATTSALAFFSQKDQPFFLMVEGAMIDTGGHWNSASTVVEEGIDFDEAIGVVLRYADEHPGTLVLITADHETGGITLPQGNTSRNEVELNFDTEDHTGIMVPIFAYGPHANLFTGIYENTEVFHKLIELMK